MKRRIASLSSLLSSLHTAAPTDPSSTKQQILQWISEEAKRRDKSPHLIRRNLIWSNHYRGAGATDKFSDACFSAIKGEGAPIVSTVKAGSDTQSLADLIESFKPSTNLSAQWVTEQVTHHNLDGKLANILFRRAWWMDDYSEVRAFVGLWLAQWAAEGTFDEVLAKDGTIRMVILTEWLKRKLHNERYRRGTEPLFRRQGARTEHEWSHLREGEENYMSEGATDLDLLHAPAITVYDEDDTPSVDFMDQEMTPEEAVCEKSSVEAHVEDFERIIRAHHPGSAERYTEVLHHLINGTTKPEMAQQMGVAPLRSGHLRCDVRKTLREGQVTRERAVDILAVLAEEPKTTRELRESTEMDTRLLNRCLRYLCDLGSVTEEDNADPQKRVYRRQ